MKFSILTLFPESISGFFDSSIIGRAKKQGSIDVELVQIREFSLDRHKKTDDAPFGGGAGMVMTVQPLKDALLSVKERNPSDRSRVVYMSPRGMLLNQQKCEMLASFEHLIVVCGHYEGVDQRFIDRYVDEEISIGDYVLTGGELAATVLVDSVSRLRKDVLGSSESLSFESHSEGLLEYPHYTRPEIYDGDRVPEILLSGHHENIRRWRMDEAIRLTKERRPDLYARYVRSHRHASKQKGRNKRVKNRSCNSCDGIV